MTPKDSIKDWMKEGQTAMPFPDFEDAVMQKVTEWHDLQAKTQQQRKYALLFFLLGLISGASLIMYGYSWLSSIAPARTESSITLAFQLIMIVFIVVFAIQLSKFIQIVLKGKFLPKIFTAKN